jgi:hypothetical protein
MFGKRSNIVVKPALKASDIKTLEKSLAVQTDEDLILTPKQHSSIRKTARYETYLNNPDENEEIVEIENIKDSIINEVDTKIRGSEIELNEEKNYDSVQFEGEIGEGSIHIT